MRHAALVFALLVLVTGSVAPVVAAGVDMNESPALTHPGSSPTALQQSDNTSTGTELVITVQPDTNATWKVITRHSLQSPADVRAFNQLVEELQSGEANSSLDEGTFRNYAALASESTGRSMAIRDVRYSGTVTEDNETGVLTMTFTWTNFAERTDSGGLEVRDVFTTPDGGTWFPWLAADQRLVIRTPAGYEVRNSFQASTQNGSLVADGPRNFRANPIYVVYGSTGVVNPPGVIPEDILSPELIAGVGAVLVLVVAGVWYLRQQDEEIPHTGADTASDPRDGPAGGAAVATDGDDEADDDETDLSLLSDEERVEHLLERNGGRMRQADIVKKTGWSDAKVSQLLSSMADEDRVNKLRIGRENLISLPDNDPRPTDEP